MSRGLVFEVDGLRLTGGVSGVATPRAIVILCHGIPSGGPSEADDRGYPGFADDLAARGYETWWFNFRGARDSEGSFTLGGWIEDLHAVTDAAAKPGLKTFVAGSSAGGAVALTAAAESNVISGVATLASPSVWTRGRDAWNETLLDHAKRIGLVSSGLIKDEMDEETWWAEFETNPPEVAVQLMGGRPLLILHGTDDDIVPAAHAYALYNKAPDPKRLVMIEGAGHQLRRDPAAVTALIEWLDDLHPADGRGRDDG